MRESFILGVFDISAQLLKRRCDVSRIGDRRQHIGGTVKQANRKTLDLCSKCSIRILTSQEVVFTECSLLFGGSPVLRNNREIQFLVVALGPSEA